nr:MAG TPA: hypothetical protein [Caudoviricetes sp.]
MLGAFLLALPMEQDMSQGKPIERNTYGTEELQA